MESRIVRVADSKWGRVISRLATHPDMMHSLSPRQFEELVAELLSRDGMQVTVTPQSVDGGRDILAVQSDQYGDHLYLVECKKYAPNRPVSVEYVRALYGVVEQERATKAILATTSRFTGPAVTFQSSVRYRMTLRGCTESPKPMVLGHILA